MLILIFIFIYLFIMLACEVKSWRVERLVIKEKECDENVKLVSDCFMKLEIS